MKVTELVLRNFRNITECRFMPDPKLNFLVGENGQGKTSFLEALGFLATLRSFRGSKSQEVMRWGELTSEVSCRLAPENDSGWQTDLKVVFNASDPTREKVSKVA